MQLLSRREYNLILRSLDKYELYMNAKEKQLSEDLQDKLYYNLYNPKDGVAQTNVDLSALYDIKTEKDTSEDNVIRSLNFTSICISSYAFSLCKPTFRFTCFSCWQFDIFYFFLSI